MGSLESLNVADLPVLLKKVLLWFNGILIVRDHFHRSLPPQHTI